MEHNTMLQISLIKNPISIIQLKVTKIKIVNNQNF